MELEMPLQSRSDVLFLGCGFFWQPPSAQVPFKIECKNQSTQDTWKNEQGLSLSLSCPSCVLRQFFTCESVKWLIARKSCYARNAADKFPLARRNTYSH